VDPTRESSGRGPGAARGFRLVDPLSIRAGAILWMVPVRCIDMNAWYSRIGQPRWPDFVSSTSTRRADAFALCVRVARVIK
jgi:hypothetical protein